MASVLTTSAAAAAYNFDEHMEIDGKTKSDLEDGEVSDACDAPPGRVYENNAKDIFPTGIDIFSPQAQEKLDERAKRFNIDPKTTPALTDEQINELYNSLGITDPTNNRSVRFDAVHLRGTDEMSTEDVFQYFKLYGPATIEWINDCSCNVVWLDRSSAARALKGMSRPIKNLPKPTGDKISDDNNSSSDVNMEEDASNMNSSDNCVDASTIDTPIPPGFWRLGNDAGPKAKFLLMRYATHKDRKSQNAEKMSAYYKRHGNPNYGGLRGIITDRKRKSYYQHHDDNIRDESNNIDLLLESGKKNPWGDLSKMWAVSENSYVNNNDNQRQRPYYRAAQQPPRLQQNNPRISKALKDRIGTKRERQISPQSDSEEHNISSENNDESDLDTMDDLRKRAKIPRMKMYADEEEQRLQKTRSRYQNQREQQQRREPHGYNHYHDNNNTDQDLTTTIRPMLRRPDRYSSEEDDREYGATHNKDIAKVPMAKTMIRKPGDVRSRLGSYVHSTTTDTNQIRGRRGKDYHRRESSYDDEEEDDGTFESDNDNRHDDDIIVSGASYKGSVVNVVRPVRPALASAIARTTTAADDVLLLVEERRRNNTSESDTSRGGGSDHHAEDGGVRRKSFSRPGFDKADLRSRLSNKSIYKNKKAGVGAALKVEIDNEYYSD